MALVAPRRQGRESVTDRRMDRLVDGQREREREREKEREREIEREREK